MIKYSLSNFHSTTLENIKYKFYMHQRYGYFAPMFNKIDL